VALRHHSGRSAHDDGPRCIVPGRWPHDGTAAKPANIGGQRELPADHLDRHILGADPALDRALVRRVRRSDGPRVPRVVTGDLLAARGLAAKVIGLSLQALVLVEDNTSGLDAGARSPLPLLYDVCKFMPKQLTSPVRVGGVLTGGKVDIVAARIGLSAESAGVIAFVNPDRREVCTERVLHRRAGAWGHRLPGRARLGRFGRDGASGSSLHDRCGFRLPLGEIRRSAGLVVDLQTLPALLSLEPHRGQHLRCRPVRHSQSRVVVAAFRGLLSLRLLRQGVA
jgi:hypothetical protein